MDDFSQVVSVIIVIKAGGLSVSKLVSPKSQWKEGYRKGKCYRLEGDASRS